MQVLCQTAGLTRCSQRLLAPYRSGDASKFVKCQKRIFDLLSLNRHPCTVLYSQYSTVQYKQHSTDAQAKIRTRSAQCDQFSDTKRENATQDFAGSQSIWQKDISLFLPRDCLPRPRRPDRFPGSTPPRHSAPCLQASNLTPTCEP